MSLRFPTICALTVLAFASLSCQPAETAVEPPPLESDEDKAFYALGFRLAEGLSRFELTPEELERVVLGIRDRIGNQPSRIEDRARYTRMSEGIQQERSQAAAEREREQAALYMAEMAAEEGAVKRDSGVVFLSLSEGTGPPPTPDSSVTVHYHGTLRDGRVFDSSRDRGETASFPLNRVIPCWTEAIPLMKTGGKAKISCPPDRAYGDRPAGMIPPGSALTFEVELIEVSEG